MRHSPSVDTVALAAVITTGAVGLGGIAGTVWTAGRPTRLAREQRQAAAYIEVLFLVEREGQWIQNTKKNLQLDRQDIEYGFVERIAVPKPDPADRATVAAQLDAFGSDIVQSLYREWCRTADEGRTEHWNIGVYWQENCAPDEDVPDSALKKFVNEIGPAEARAREDVAHAIAKELRHRRGRRARASDS